MNPRPRSGAVPLLSALVAVLTLALGVVALATYTGGVGAGDPAASAEPAEGGGDGFVAAVELDEFEIRGDLTVPADTPLTIDVVNVGGVPHDFVIDGVAESPLLAGGESATLEVDGLAAGEYEVVCLEAGHADAGMAATLTVTDDVAEESADAEGDADHDDHGADTSAEEMAAKHDDLEYPVATDGGGNQPLEPEVDGDGTKRFELTAEHIQWETEPGEVREALAYNGQVPGPRIDVDAGDEVEIVLHNELEVPTALHLHGLVLDNDMDGVPGITQDSVMPGESFTYEFTARADNTGSHMYHSHFDAANQVPEGLLGALVIHGEDDLEVDHDVVMVLNDGPLGYTINGKGFPATEPVVVDEGDLVRVRYYNEGLQIHPMHLHGIPQRVVARDGYELEVPYTEDNVLVSPGDRVDVLIEATEPGVWAWHCHILNHAEGPDGMFGMVTALIVE